MHPISVEGLEHITGIFGRIEENDNEVAPIIQKSCTSDKKYEKTGKPNDGALVWAHIAFFLEGNTTPFNSSKLQKGGEQVLINFILLYFKSSFFFFIMILFRF